MKDQYDIRELEKELAEVEKLEKEMNQQPIAKTDSKPPDERSFKWVRHGDHWDKVPIAEANAPTAKDVPVYQPPVTKTYHGPLTYHAELLKTNPVKALRLQSEERGHWSKDWIPPFPPDDAEAQAYARNQYLRQYYRSIGDTKTPEFDKAVSECLSMLDTIMTYEFSARVYDLLKLTWPNLPAGTAYHDDSTPSDYFPNYHTERGLELLRSYYPNLFNDHNVQTDNRRRN